jgi:hypothetical protein
VATPIGSGVDENFVSLGTFSLICVAGEPQHNENKRFNMGVSK